MYDIVINYLSNSYEIVLLRRAKRLFLGKYEASDSNSDSDSNSNTSISISKPERCGRREDFDQ